MWVTLQFQIDCFVFVLAYVEIIFLNVIAGRYPSGKEPYYMCSTLYFNVLYFYLLTEP